MSSSSSSSASPEVITLDESVQEIVELDHYKPNPPLSETIDISNESFPPEDDFIKVLESPRISTVEPQEKNTVTVPSPPKNKLEQDVESAASVSDEHDLGAKSSPENNVEDTCDVQPAPKNNDQEMCVEPSPKDNDQDESAKSSPKSTPPEDDSSKPFVKVVFRDKAVFQKNCKKIESFLKMLLIPEVGKNNISCNITDTALEIFESAESNRIKLKRMLNKDLSKSSNDDLFTIDVAPQVTDEADIPVYKKFRKTLDKPADEERNDACPQFTCFNCLGNHNLRDCDQPKNYSAINKNRKEFALKKGPTVSRYHLEDDQKYDHFVPGQISDKLKKALGLRENCLPNYIYRMRRLGYPPGWMEEARLQHSGLSLFNSEGVAEQGSDEEGEIVNPGDKDKYDINKINDYPGFNVPAPEGTRDEEFNQYWGSQVQQNNSKEAMLFYLSSKKTDDGYKRKKLSHPANSSLRTDINPGEMELEDDVSETVAECVPTTGLFIPPLPKDDVPPPPPPGDFEDSESPGNQSQEDTSTISNDDCITQVSRENSPSLVDLEDKKSKLLAELEQPHTAGNTLIANLPKSDSLVEEAGDETAGSESNNLSKTDDLNNANVNSPKTPNGLVRKSVISVHVGTPIINSVSPFKNLPSAEKFSKNICDVINFENLPDSTGKYDQMSELLLKVRKTLRKQ